MSELWSAIVNDLTPYVPGEQPTSNNVIKLNTNENPYGPSPAALDAIRAEATDSLRLYPDPQAQKLKAALAKFHTIREAQVFVGNGSDEVLAHIFHGLLKHDEPILFPDISYSFYPVYCGLYDVAFKTVAVNDSFEIDLDEYPSKNGGVIFPNPNAPTGRALSRDKVKALLNRNRRSVVVVDEAYIAFGGHSLVDLIELYDNLLVVQTLSKSHALAGLRVGFAFGDRKLIEALERVKNSFNPYPLDRLAIAGAVAAIEDRTYFESSRDKVLATRERLSTALRGLGFEVLPSQTNFVFVSHKTYSANTIAQALRDRSILVRHFDHPRTMNFLRVTVGTDIEVDALLNALRDISGLA
jgi:histidinol-phosphate aminotransferase